MKNQELKPSPKTIDQEIDLLELVQKTWKIVILFFNILLYKLTQLLLFTLHNLHWFAITLILSIGLGWWQFSKTGTIYEATTVIHVPNDNALLYVRDIENIDKLLCNKEYNHLIQSTSLDTSTIGNILSLKYAYGILTTAIYPTYFTKKIKPNNKQEETLSQSYLQLSIQTKQAFSEDSIKHIIRSLLLKNNYVIENFKLYLTEKENLLSVLNQAIIDAQKAAKIELVKKDRHTNINNIFLSAMVDTTTLVRPLKLQREKIKLERELELLKNGPIVFVNDFYFSKVINSRTGYIIHWGVALEILTYIILLIIKRRKKIVSFMRKINENIK